MQIKTKKIIKKKNSYLETNYQSHEHDGGHCENKQEVSTGSVYGHHPYQSPSFCLHSQKPTIFSL